MSVSHSPFVSLPASRRAVSLAIFLVVTVLAAACGSAPASRPASAEPQPTTAVTEPSAEATAVPPETSAGARDQAAGAGAAPTGPAAIEPPLGADGLWLVDEEGHEYQEIDWPASQPLTAVRNPYLVGEWVQHPEGGLYQVVVRDEERLTLRFYRYINERSQRVEPPAEDEEARRAEEAAVAASYEVETREVDRLRFRSYSEGLPERGQWRNGFALADMNGDGHLDIVHGPARKDMGALPLIILGDGQGGWRVWQETSFPSGPYDYGDVEVVDLDGDGLPDLVLGVHQLGVRALIAEAPGRFREWGGGLPLPRSPADQSRFGTRAVAVADFDGDGRPDIVALGEGPPSFSRPSAEVLSGGSFGPRLFLNSGDGTWREAAAEERETQVFGDYVAIGDFNGDGRPDVATANQTYDQNDIVRLGLGGGRWQTSEVESLRPKSFVHAVAAGDLDGDGRDELIVAYMSFELLTWRSGIDVLSLAEDGTWGRRQVLAARPGRDRWSALAIGDVDGDGHLDVVAADARGRIDVFLGDGSGKLARQSTADIAAVEKECTAYDIQLGDLDGDGRDEIVASFAGEPSALWAPDVCLSGGAIRAWDALPR